MPPRSDKRLFLGILALFLLVAVVASVPPWLERRQMEAASVRVVRYPRDLILGKERHSRGPANAPFVLVEFGDFCCPNCARFTPILEEILRKHPRDLRHVFRHYPITEKHDSAMTAALVAEAAGEQGKFWEMYALLFGTPGEKDTQQFRDFARRLGMDMKRAARTAGSAATRAYVENDRRDGEQLTVHVTPTFFFLTPTQTYMIISGEYLEDFLDDQAHWR